MSRHGGGGASGPAGADQLGVRVGYVSGVTMGVLALYGVFVFPFHRPRAFFTTLAFCGAWGGIWWLFGGDSNALADTSMFAWAPIIGLAYWLHRNEQPREPRMTVAERRAQLDREWFEEFGLQPGEMPAHLKHLEAKPKPTPPAQPRWWPF